MWEPALALRPAFVSASPALPAGRARRLYAEALGWEVTYADDDTVQLGGGPVGLGFQRVAGSRGPSWPDAAKHAHLDLEVGDLAATRPDFRPRGGDWTVLQDPGGRLFCLAES